MKRTSIALILVLALALLSGCVRSAALKDGSYVGQSAKDDRGAHAEVSIRIQDGKITECQFVTWQQDGTLKDENYGKVNGEITNPDTYEKAQVAVRAMEQYAQQLVQVQKPKDVDAVSGATATHQQFVQAAEAALKEASK